MKVFIVDQSLDRKFEYDGTFERGKVVYFKKTSNIPLLRRFIGRVKVELVCNAELLIPMYKPIAFYYFDGKNFKQVGLKEAKDTPDLARYFDSMEKASLSSALAKQGRKNLQNVRDGVIILACAVAILSIGFGSSNLNTAVHGINITLNHSYGVWTQAFITDQKYIGALQQACGIKSLNQVVNVT